MLTKTANELIGKKARILDGFHKDAEGTIDRIILEGSGGRVRVIAPGDGVLEVALDRIQYCTCEENEGCSLCAKKPPSYESRLIGGNLCPPHLKLFESRQLESVDQCIACLRNERDELRRLITDSIRDHTKCRYGRGFMWHDGLERECKRCEADDALRNLVGEWIGMRTNTAMVYVGTHPVILRCNQCGLMQTQSFKCPTCDGGQLIVPSQEDLAEYVSKETIKTAEFMQTVRSECKHVWDESLTQKSCINCGVTVSMMDEAPASPDLAANPTPLPLPPTYKRAKLDER